MNNGKWEIQSELYSFKYNQIGLDCMGRIDYIIFCSKKYSYISVESSCQIVLIWNNVIQERL